MSSATDAPLASVAPKLSSKWSPVKQFSPFYSGGVVIYNERRHVLFSPHEDSVLVIDPMSSLPICRIGGLCDSVQSFTVSRDGGTVITAGHSHLIRIWKLDWSRCRQVGGRTEIRLVDDDSAEMIIDSRTLPKDEKAGFDVLVKSELAKAWKGPSSMIRTMALSSVKENLLGVGCMDGSLYMYDMDGGFCTHSFPKHPNKIELLKFHPTRLLVLTACDDGIIRIHDLYRHVCIGDLVDHMSLPTDFDFIQTGSSVGGLISSSRDSVVNVWSLDSLDQTLSVEIKKAANEAFGTTDSNNVCISVGTPLTTLEKKLARLVSGNTIKKQKKKNKEIEKENDMIKSSVDFWLQADLIRFPKLKPLHQIGVEESIECVLCVGTKHLSQVKINENYLSDLCPWVFITAGESGHLSVWSPSDRKKLINVKTPHQGRLIYLSHHLSPVNEHRLLLIGEDENFTFWNTKSLQMEKLLLGNSTELIHCSFLPNQIAHHSLLKTSEMINSADDESKEVAYERGLLLRSTNTITILEMSKGRTSASFLMGHQNTVLCVDTSCDGCWIASGSKDHSIRIWSARTEKALGIIRGHSAPVVALQINKKPLKSIACSCLSEGVGTMATRLPVEASAGGMFIVSVCLEGILKVWSIDRNLLRKQLISDQEEDDDDILEITTESIASVVSHDSEVNSIAIAPNDKITATASSDKSIKIWTLPTLTLIGTCKGHRKAVWGVTFSPIEKVIASTSGDQTIKLWSLKDFTCLKTLQGHHGSVISVEFLTHGTQLMSISSCGQLKLWNIRTSDCVSTFDHHEGEKIWSLAFNQEMTKMMTCGADNKLIIWKDVTEESERLQFEKMQIEMEQTSQIERLEREGNVFGAIALSIRLNKPHLTQKLFKESFEKLLFHDLDATDQTAMPKIKENDLMNLLTSLKDEDLKKLLQFVVKWNANGHTASLANVLMNHIIKYLPSSRLMKIEGFLNMASSFVSYLPRHTNRISALIQKTFIIDMILNSSGIQSGVPDLPIRKIDNSQEMNKIDHQVLTVTDAYDVIFG